MNTRGEVKVVRAQASAQTSIDLSSPPSQQGWIAVATFHSHDFGSSPSSTVPGWVTGDLDINNKYELVPGLILGESGSGSGSAEDWTTYGPERGFFNIGVPERCRRTKRAGAGAKGRAR